MFEIADMYERDVEYEAAKPGREDRADPDRLPWRTGTDACAGRLPADVGLGQGGVAQMRTQDSGYGMRDSGTDGLSRFRPLSRILHPASCTKGFTLIELIIVIAIIFGAGGMFLVRIPYYQEQAEKTAMQQVDGALQSALVLQYGTLITRGAAN